MPGAGSDDLSDQIRQQALAWSSEFSKSDPFASLTDLERRWSEAIVLEFIQAMHRIHNRPPRRWTAQSVTECCTQTLPARVTAQASFFQAMVPVLTRFITYLATIGALSNGPVLNRALHRVQARIVAQAAAPDNWNMTKTLLTHAGNNGFDPQNPQDMESFIDRVNAGEIPEILPFPGKHAHHSQAPASPTGSPLAVRATPPHVLPQLVTLVNAIARDLAKGKAPNLTDALVVLLEQHPNILLDMLPILAARMREPKEAEHDPVLEAWFIVLGFHLEQVRYGIDRNFTRAKNLIAAFQAETIRMTRDDSLPSVLLNAIIASLHEARLQPEPELLGAYEAIMEKSAPARPPTAREMQDMFETLFANSDDDIFQIHAQMDHMLRVVPPEMQKILLQEMHQLQRPLVAEAMALLVLHPQDALRLTVREMLAQSPARIAPDTVRRLIVLRNWLPPNERALLDQTIRSARQHGVSCAQWSTGEEVINRYALAMDGGGALGFFLLSQADRQQRLSSMLAKRNFGIVDAWCGEAIPHSAMRRQLRLQILEEGFQIVSGVFSDLMVKHHLHVGLEHGHPPPPGLLQIAETVAATDWQPEAANFATRLQAICDTAGPQDASRDAVIVHSSHVWAQELDIVQSWFMESQSLVDYLHVRRRSRPATLLAGILKEFFEPARLEWSERLAWTAIWLHEQPPVKGKPHPLAHRFALLAQLLFQGHPMEEIPLMELLAQNTIDAARVAPPF
ncbi:MAG: hypothetical protein HQL63_15465 [Magnetococcales bacterium]|nr:hypothetical protein [Magnetococcales bacterium]